MTVIPCIQEPEEVTADLCHWVNSLSASNIPQEILTRAKYLILDGIGCGLVGARVPWSEKYIQATREFESPGSYNVIGQRDRFGPVAAATMNAAFIQACELDDYHSQAPLHSASIAISTLFAAAQARAMHPTKPRTTTGMDLLLAAIACFETGPRVGKAVHGTDMLTRGWHSGAIFGAPASAIAASRLFELTDEEMEGAVGIACTQACGLMSAQYEGMVKRVQHGFAARNGLLGALLSRGGYTGIKKVLERPYGGYLAMFSQGNGKKQQYKPQEVIDRLGEYWETYAIRVKLHACCGLTHGTVEAIARLRREHSSLFSDLTKIKKIYIDLSEATFAHCGFKPDERPVTSTGAQMSIPYIAASELVDGSSLLNSFSEADGNLDRDEVWSLVDKVLCAHERDFDKPDLLSASRVVIEFENDQTVQALVKKPRGVDSPITNDEILKKWRVLAGQVASPDLVSQIEDAVLSLDTAASVDGLIEMLNVEVGKALD